MRGCWILFLAISSFVLVTHSDAADVDEHHDEHQAAEEHHEEEHHEEHHETDSEHADHGEHHEEGHAEEHVAEGEDTSYEESDAQAAAEDNELKLDDENDEQEEELLSSDQIQAMHKKIDANGDGKLSMAEILEFSKNTRKAIARKDVDVLMQEMDGNKDGKVSLEEHIKSTFAKPEAPEGVTDEEKAEQEDPAKEKTRKELEVSKFHAADANKDKHLDKEELPAVVAPETYDSVLSIVAADILKAKDKNGDKELHPEEFWESDGGEDEDTKGEQSTDFVKLDVDKNGKLNLEEMKHWESGAFHTHDAMKQLFEVADQDSDHHISAEELDNARGPITGSQAASHMQEWAEHHEL